MLIRPNNTNVKRNQHDVIDCNLPLTIFHWKRISKNAVLHCIANSEHGMIWNNVLKLVLSNLIHYIVYHTHSTCGLKRNDNSSWSKYNFAGDLEVAYKHLDVTKSREKVLWIKILILTIVHLFEFIFLEISQFWDCQGGTIHFACQYVI